MRISVPAEVKNNEFRVAITPAGVHELVVAGHEVFVQAHGQAARTFPARLPLLRLDRIYVRNAIGHAPVVLPWAP